MKTILFRHITLAAVLMSVFLANAQDEAQELYLFEHIQSQEFNRTLLNAGYRVITESDDSEIDPSDFTGSDKDDGSDGELQNIPISLTFINLSSAEYRSEVYEEVIRDLNGIFSELESGRNKYSVEFCWNEVAAARSFEYETRDFEELLEGWSFEHIQWLTFYEESIKDDLFFTEDIQIYIVDLPQGSAGFSGSFMDGDELISRIVVLDEDLILKNQSLKVDSKTLAHLICNSVGMRSLWAENDFIDDTPTHHLQNLGASSLKGTHVAFTSGMPEELIYNLMDNTTDVDATELTAGQQEFLVQRLISVAEKSQYDYAECKDLSFRSENDGIVQIEDQDENLHAELRISPNPSKDFLNIRISIAQEEILTLSIYDMSGRAVLNSVIPKGRIDHRINVQQLDDGLYTLTAIGRGGVISSHNFIKTN